MLFGHGPDKPDDGLVVGKVGSNLSLEEGQDAARLTGISMLATLKEEIGDLNRVRRIVKVMGMGSLPGNILVEIDMIVEIKEQNI